MNSRINITSGTLTVLNNIKNKYPKRHLSLFQSTSHSNYILIDNSNLKTVFRSPIQYKINKHKGSQKWGSLISFIHLTLNHRHIRILSSYINTTLQLPLAQGMINFYYLTDEINSSNQILLTNWYDLKNYVDWKKNSFVHFFTKTDNNYYQNIFCNIN